MSTPKTDNSKLWKVIEEGLDKREGWEASAVLPKNLLLAIRAALESGLSCEEISAYVLLASGLEEMKGKLENTSLLERVNRISTVMSHSIDSQ